MTLHPTCSFTMKHLGSQMRCRETATTVIQRNGTGDKPVSVCLAHAEFRLWGDARSTNRRMLWGNINGVLKSTGKVKWLLISGPGRPEGHPIARSAAPAATSPAPEAVAKFFR